MVAPISSSSSRWETLLALGIPALLLFGRLGHAGIWDPYELRVADLGRRAAIHVLHAPWLTLPGAENQLPTLGDVGQNELPVLSIAVAYRLLGLGAWTGRFPMALWGFAGVVVLWAWLRRMASPRAATYATLALSTMPLYFVQARTMLGDVVAMTSLLASFAGLSVALLDARISQRLPWLLLGFFGLIAGFFCRGALLGVAVPMVSVAGAWLLTIQEDEVRPAWPTWTVAAALLISGVAAAMVAMDALEKATPLQFYRALGSAVYKGQKYPTFDVLLQQLGHALFPWSAFLPVALGRLLIPTEERRERALRSVLILGLTLSYGSSGWIASKTGALPFLGVGLLAGIVGLVLTDFERGAHASRALVVTTGALLVLFVTDFSRMPEKTMAAFVLQGLSFPDGFQEDSKIVIRLTALLFGGAVVLAFLDPHGERGGGEDGPWYRRWTAWGEVEALLRELTELWQGNLAFVAVMLEAMLVGLGALLFLGDRFRWKITLAEMLGAELRWGVMNAWWIVPLSLLLALLGAWTLRLWFCRVLLWSGVSRASVVVAGGVSAGAVLALGYYPALGAQLSPQQALETYQRQHRAGEPLGLLGVTGRSVGYYTGGEARSFSEPSAAFSWLIEGAGRRWLAVRSDELPALNALYRAQALIPGFVATPDHNLLIVDARSSQVLLASNLPSSATNQNPLASLISSEVPSPMHPVRANLDGRLESLGWDLFEGGTSRRVQEISPGKSYELVLYWRVLAPLSTQWKGFIHIDGSGRRHNGDHDVLGGKIPMRLWQVGDVVSDRYELRLEPNFTPGDYTMFYGFFLGARRMSVREGNHSEDRLNGGTIRVR